MGVNKKYPPYTALPALSAAGKPFPDKVREIHIAYPRFKIVRNWEHVIHSAMNSFILSKRQGRSLTAYKQAFERVTKIVTLMVPREETEIIRAYGYGRNLFHSIPSVITESMEREGLSDWVPWSGANTPPEVAAIAESIASEIRAIDTVTDAQYRAVMGGRLGKRPATPANFCDMFPEISDRAEGMYYYLDY
jgi:hypothetical protein